MKTKSKINRWLLTAAILGVYSASKPLLADDQTETIKELKKQIESLDQKVRVLERHRELDGEASAEKNKQAPRVTIGADGFSASSADSNFVFKVRGYVQADGRFFLNDKNPINDTFLLRRVRPIFEGTVFQNYDYRVMLDFGANTSGSSANTGNNGLLQDAYLNVHYWPQFQIQVGKFKPPVGLERLQSGANLLFVERGLPTLLVPNRDVGLQVHGELFNGALNYAAGVFNGIGNGGSGDIEIGDDHKDLAARLFAQPFKNSNIAPLRGLGLGVAGSFGNQAGALRNFVTTSQQTFFSFTTSTGTNVTADGNLWRISPQGYWYWGPFGLFGEYVFTSQELRRDTRTTTQFATAKNDAWQIAASYVLTGEENSWKGVRPARPFSVANRSWGAWEIAGRVGQLSLDEALFPLFATGTSAHGVTSWGVGLNWYLNRYVKLNLDYEQTSFRNGSNKANSLTARDAQTIFTRVQFGF